MKKKVIGSCILLLVLLLGLSINSYAVVNPQLQKLDIPVSTDKQTIFEEVYTHYYNVNINNLNSSQLNSFNTNKSTFINSPISGITYQFNPNGGQSSGYHLNFWSTDNKDKLNFPTSGAIYASNISYSSCLHGQLRGKSSLSYFSWTETNYPIIQNNPSYTTYYVLQQDKLGYWWEWSTDGWSIGEVLTPPFDFIANGIGTIYLPNDGGNTNIAYCINPVFGPGVSGMIELGQVVNYETYNKLGVYCMWYYYVSGDTMFGNIVSSSNYSLRDGVLRFNPTNLYEHTVYEFMFSQRDEEDNLVRLGSVYFYVGLPSANPIFGSGDYSWNNPQVIVEAIVGQAGSGDDGGTGILGGISSFFRNLFIPDSDYMINYVTDLKTTFSTKLGFLYDGFEIFTYLLQKILEIDYNDMSFSIGPYNLPLFDDIQLIPELSYDLNDILEDETMNNIHNIYFLIIDGLVIIGFVALIDKIYMEVVGDKNDS